ncbi:deacylase-like protein [Salinisphaera sp. PC39]|uniref:succinylglutamate desuccinylase/aspartoacylase family protein n=1 Tax=Salinisphaera sp. PC39 TaxID=1304156 RepID=UPI00333F01F2
MPHTRNADRWPPGIRSAGLLLIVCGMALGPAHADEGEEEAPAPVAEPPAVAAPATPGPDAEVPDAGPAPFRLLDAEVPPGETRRLSWVASESFAGIAVPTPVLVAHGAEPGPVLCLTAAVHGDELNGIEMVRRVLYGLAPGKLVGTVVGVPIVNLFGFRRSSRYLPDRRDLNRYFPGNPDGSSASRIAHAFFNDVVRHCDYLVDLHTGSFHRTNLPQLRADLDDPAVLELTRGFGATAVLQSRGSRGTLRRAATEAGIPAVTLEAGEPMRFQPEEVEHGVKGIRTLLNKLGMVTRISLWGEPQPVYYESVWVRADTGGILFSKVALGERVTEGDALGTVTDPITNKRATLTAPAGGRILGMALNQVVIPGFAAYRIGIEKSSDQIEREAGTIRQRDDDAPAAHAEDDDNGDRPVVDPPPGDNPPEDGERPD